MGGLNFWHVGIMAGVAVLTWLVLRSRRADRPAIEEFVKQQGLRLISATRSYNVVRCWFRDISVNSYARLYDLIVEDHQHNQGFLKVALARSHLRVLEQHGLDLVDLLPARLRWYERLTLIGCGAAFGGFMFSGMLHTTLSPPNRPIFPSSELGYIYSMRAKYGASFGTYFEYLVVSYGVLAMSAFYTVCALYGYILGVQNKSRTYPQQAIVAALVSFALYWALWKMFLSGT